MTAKTLRDLFRIREANLSALDAIEGSWGSALGLKNGDGEPSILVFVRQKIGEAWLAPGQKVPSTLQHQGLSCPTDVISGDSERDVTLQIFDAGESPLGYRHLSSLVDTDALSSANIELLDRLRGSAERLTPGCQISYLDSASESKAGTIGCFARDRRTGTLGFLTNQHVGEFPGNKLYFPDIGSRTVGIVVRGILDIRAADRFDRSVFGSVDPTSRFKVDAGFCEFDAALKAIERDAGLPVIEKFRTPNEELVERKLGQPLSFDGDSMDPVGLNVIGVGRTRGFQKGVVRGFAYEYLVGGVRWYSDLLIVGENNEFGGPGNSGTLIVSDPDLRPLGMKWGGIWAQRRKGKGLENWTDATEIGLILKLLDIEIVEA